MQMAHGTNAIALSVPTMANQTIVMEMPDSVSSIPMSVNNQRVITEPVADTVIGFDACATRLLEGDDSFVERIPLHVKQEIISEYEEQVDEEEEEEVENQIPSPSCDISMNKDSRRRNLNPIWKSLLTDQLSNETIQVDGSHLAKRVRLDSNQINTILLGTKDDLSYSNIVKSEHLVASVARELEIETTSIIDRPKPDFNFESLRNSSRDRGTQHVFACFVCGKTFVSEKYLSMHISLHNSKQIEDMPAQDEDLSNDVKMEPDYINLDEASFTSVEGQTPTFAPNQLTPEGKQIVTRKLKKSNQKASGDGGWTCALCNKSFAHNSGYKNHMRTHSNERPYVCQICDIGFKEKYHLKKHNLFIHSSELPEKCSFCGKRFKDSTAVRAHERIHSDARPFACRRCSKTFKTSECLWHHEHRSKTCGQALGDVIARERQVRKRRKFPPSKEVNEDDAAAASIKADPQEILYVSKLAKIAPAPTVSLPTVIESTTAPSAVAESKPVTLPVARPHQQCQSNVAIVQPMPQVQKPKQAEKSETDELKPQVLPTENIAMAQELIASLMKNPSQTFDVNTTAKSAAFTCQICAKSFLDATSFQRHSKVHTEERPFVCPKCDIGFKMKVHLKKHNLYVHSDEYHCECQFCGKKFKDSSAVKLHERTHSDSRPFKCDGCVKAFKTRENLWGHQHRGKCIASKKKTDMSASANTDKGFAKASVNAEQVSAQAFVQHNQVTAHASFENNHVTAHASFNNNKLTAHATINSHHVTAHATIGEVKDNKIQPLSHDMGIRQALQGNLPQQTSLQAVYIPAQSEKEIADGIIAQHLNRKSEAEGSPVSIHTSEMVNTLSGQPIPEIQQIQEVTTSEEELKEDIKWPTLKEFLQRGMELAIEPSQPVFQQAAKLTTRKTDNPPTTIYPSIKDRLARSLYSDSSPRPQLQSETEDPGSASNSPSAIPSFSATFLAKRTPPPPLPSILQGDKSSPMLSSDDPNIPIIYWDEDIESKRAKTVWTTEADTMLHDISETVFAQL